MLYYYFEKKMNLNIILFLFNLFIYISPVIHIRFYRYLSIIKEPNNISLIDFISHRIKNIYTTDIYLGNPPQEIPGLLNISENEFYITNDNCIEKNYFHKANSTSFIYDKNNLSFLDSLFFYRSLYSPNYFTEVENYTFAINNNNIDLPLCFHIGTQLLSDAGENNIINVLHKNKYIQSYNYYFKAYSDDELYLIFDAYIKDEDSINYKFIRPLSYNYNNQIRQKWGLQFNYILWIIKKNFILYFI